MTEVRSPQSSAIVDGHGPDAAHPPGPELRRLTDALRRMIDQVVRTDASPAVLTRVADAVEDASAALAAETPPWTISVPAAIVPSTDPHEFFPFSPMVGFYNALAPPVHCEVRDGEVVGRVTLGAAYEGPPGCAHGGILAGLFDEILGIANIASGHGAMTGTLTIRYRSPTPLYTELTCRAATDRVEGRKVFTSGSIWAGERLCAECEGIFISVEHERFVEHARAHGAGS